MRVLFLISVLAASLSAWGAEKPNIIILLADDLGQGDLGCYGATRVRTPRIDALAAGGLRFTDAHASAATCTPSRFSLLTGEYAFRQKGTGILPGDARLIIAPGRPTLPAMFRHAGYRTAAVGKWHLGLGDAPIDWNTDIKPGPLEVGFDSCFIMPATADRVPCVYLRDHRVVGLDPADPITVSYTGPLDDAPTGRTHPELLRMGFSNGHNQTIVNGVSRIGYLHGGKAALWTDETMAATYAGEAVKFIEANKDGPFFLYFAPTEVHVPRLPAPRFVGQTQMGPRGDVITQLDWETGEILDALARLHLTEKTLVLFSSDNGPVLDDGYKDEAVEKLGDHHPAGAWRGGKYSAFEGGTRVPFLVSWPGRVKPGVSAALLSQVDFLATFAALVGEPAAGPDSQNVLPALLGQSPAGRESLVESANVLGLRVGPWKYVSPSQGPKIFKSTATETGLDPAGLLFDLSADPGEQNSLLAEQPEKAREMAARLEKIREEGAARP